MTSVRRPNGRLPVASYAVAFACAAMWSESDASSGSVQTNSLETTTWRWTRVAADSAIRDRDRFPSPTLTLKDGRAFGFTGCNQFSARYRIDGRSVTFQRLTYTRKGCVDSVAAKMEETLITKLPRVRSWVVKGMTLVLRDSAGRPILTYERPR